MEEKLILQQILAQCRDIKDDLGIIKRTSLCNKQILTLEEFCDYASISKSNGYRLISEGRIKYSKPNGKRIYIRKEDADEYLLQGQKLTAQEKENSVLKFTINKHVRTKKI